MTELQEKYVHEPLIYPGNIVKLQLCFICGKWIKLSSDPMGRTWLHVGDMTRHRKCKPEAIR
jgi:hypothetical protein